MTATPVLSSRSRRLRFVITAAILSAISVVLMLFAEFMLPIFPAWLKVDLSAIPAMVGGFAMGPLMGVVVILVKDLLHFLAKGLAQDMGLGNLADLIVCLMLVLPTALVYKYHRTFKGALWGMVLGTVLATLVGGPLANLAVLPGYITLYFQGAWDALYAATRATNGAVNDLWGYMLFVVVPFNLFKSLAVCIVTYALYKPLSPVLHKYR